MKNSDSGAKPYNNFTGSVPRDQLPREKALSLGMKALSDVELMAIVFGTGIQGKDVVSLCTEILAASKGHLSKIASTSAADFIKANKGIGPAKALTLLAGIELGLRAAADAVKLEEPLLNSSEAAFRYMNHHLNGLGHEEFWVILMKNNLQPIKEICVSHGGLTMTVVDPKVIIREALLNNATAMMLFHNHPSGILKPSPQDDMLTRKIKDAAALFDIRVPDHIIIGNHRYYSYHDEGKL